MRGNSEELWMVFFLIWSIQIYHIYLNMLESIKAYNYGLIKMWERVLWHLSWVAAWDSHVPYKKPGVKLYFSLQSNLLLMYTMKASDHVSYVWASAFPSEDQNKVPSFWLLPCQAMEEYLYIDTYSLYKIRKLQNMVLYYHRLYCTL